MLRIIKTEEEIELIREACRITSGALAMLRDYLKPGVTTLKLDELTEDYIRSNGGEPAFKGYLVDSQRYKYALCASKNNAVVHGLPTNEELKEGDIISLDTGVKYKGYHGDSAVTYPVGEITAENKNLLEVTLESLNLGIEQAIEGNRVFDISQAVQDCVNKYGYGIVRDLVGHGIGRNLHEEPSVPNFVPSPFNRHKYKNVELQEGMTFCIEPMINMGTYKVKLGNDHWTILTNDNKNSAHFEHTIVVRKGKAEVLTYHKL